MKSICFFLMCYLILLFSSYSNMSFASSNEPKIVTAAQVNGTWRSNSGTFKVWALGKQRLQVEFFGIHEYGTEAEPKANTGEGSGLAFIEENVAIFKPKGTSGDCRLIMKFLEKKLLVEQRGECGFGRNVTASGSYKKTDDQKPSFGKL
uniref:hypothetical protein n=1 Tax=Microbulbifer agarilyticus TaxID=260552 RepID=UPI0011104FD8|nr:hypothetical protein [Microbulbifer agarilyticus]